jgi:hypothetical protein
LIRLPDSVVGGRVTEMERKVTRAGLGQLRPVCFFSAVFPFSNTPDLSSRQARMWVTGHD